VEFDQSKKKKKNNSKNANKIIDTTEINKKFSEVESKVFPIDNVERPVTPKKESDVVDLIESISIEKEDGKQSLAKTEQTVKKSNLKDSEKKLKDKVIFLLKILNHIIYKTYKSLYTSKSSPFLIL
jgi:hypothetical protein